jgi:hypothetical protein
MATAVFYNGSTSVGITTKVQVCGKTTPKQSSGTGWQQTKGLHLHSPTSVRSTRMVKVYGKTTPKQSSGTSWQQTKGMQLHSTMALGVMYNNGDGVP